MQKQKVSQDLPLTLRLPPGQRDQFFELARSRGMKPNQLGREVIGLFLEMSSGKRIRRQCSNKDDAA